MQEGRLNTIGMQRLLVVVSVVLFAVKVWAWWLTASVAILTDALESTVNVIAGIIGLYSVILSAKPKDREHPYGHGKIEFISSAIEGVLILVAGLLIIFEAGARIWESSPLRQLDEGLIIVAATALVNYIMGYYCERKGRKEHSPVLVASGSHLKTDAYSTLGILAGIALILLTGLEWIDSAAALVFAVIIIITGYRIIRRSVSGIMDESDTAIIEEIVGVLNRDRRNEWIDVHNMRVINYAGFYHIDCHLTVPYYINVNEAHDILDTLTATFRAHFGERVEFFIHVDGCLPVQCGICNVENCPVRKTAFTGHLQWTSENLLLNKKHQLEDLMRQSS